jgi:transcriptional regulator with XRE-family HTH domain
VKKLKNHLGEKIKRLRSFRGMTQEDLAKGIGKTRSLISFFERTGSINKYTLAEISRVLNITADELEEMEIESIEPVLHDRNDAIYTRSDLYQKMIERQQAEIEFLKQTISHQQHLLNQLSKSK